MLLRGDSFLRGAPQRPLAQCVQGRRLPGLPGTDSPAGPRVGAHVCTWTGGVMRAHTCPLCGWEQHSGDEDRGPNKDPQVKNLRNPTNMDPSLQRVPSACKCKCATSRSAPLRCGWLLRQFPSLTPRRVCVCLPGRLAPITWKTEKSKPKGRASVARSGREGEKEEGLSWETGARVRTGLHSGGPSWGSRAFG